MPTENRKLTYAEIDRSYKEISRLKDEIGTSLSRRDRAEVLIGACILNRFDTRHLIIKWLRVAGLSPNLVEKALDERTGPFPGEHLWRCDDTGRYHLLDDA